MIGKLLRAIEVLRRRGPSYGLYVVRGVVAPRFAKWLLQRLTARRAVVLAAAGITSLALVVGVGFGVAAGLSTLAAGLGLLLLGWLAWLAWRPLRIRRRIAEARRLAAEAETTADGLSWSSWPVPAATRAAVDRARAASGDDDLTLGRIERDGLLATDFGEFPGFETVPLDSFRARDRFDLDLVLAGDQPLIRKDFRGDADTFSREWLALERLRGKAQVPSVWRADVERCRLYRTIAPGRPLNDLLVAAGAQIRECQLESAPEREAGASLDRLPASERLEAVLARGREVLSRAVPGTFFADLELEIDRIHSCGVTGLSLTFGNLTLAEGRPWLFDFDGARCHASTRSSHFDLARDRDREKYNRIFGRSIITEAAAREILRPLDGGYSPVDLGHGLVTRGFWSIDSGTGRWEYLNGPSLAPRIVGRRVLDLGSNNGMMPILMLRAGARAVVGLEQDEALIARARDLQRLFEWRDFSRYDLELRAADMRAILEPDGETWQGFDLVTAFCSLYYLSEEEMARMVRRASEIAPILVLQAKTDTRQGPDGKAKKSSLAFQRRLLETNGFDRIEVVAPAGFTRPLLIAERTSHPGVS